MIRLCGSLLNVQLWPLTILFHGQSFPTEKNQKKSGIFKKAQHVKKQNFKIWIKKSQVGNSGHMRKKS